MRLFIAVNFPASIREQIWECTAALRGQDFPVRWIAPELLHLTLKFLGNVDGDLVSELEAVLTSLANRTRQFSMGITGVGAFPASRKPHTIWVGCDAVPGLELLQHEIEKECERLGFPVEARPFRPHITVGRVRKGAHRRQLRGLDREMERIEVSMTTHVSSVELMESKPGATGPTYHVVHSRDFVP